MIVIRGNLAGIKWKRSGKKVGMDPETTGASRLDSLDAPKRDQLRLSM